MRIRILFLIFLSLLTAPLAAGPIETLDLGDLRGVRLLVLSPHPDDGTLGGGGVIARVAAAGGAVRIVEMTNGDAFSKGVKLQAGTETPTAEDYRRYGTLREQESVSAMAALGVAESNVTFLGFPDDGLCRLVTDYRSALTGIYQSPYTKRSSPPSIQQLLPGTAYRGDDVERELRQIVVGSSRVDLQACKLEYSIVSPK